MNKQLLIFLATLLPMMASADDSGICGDNLTWTYVKAAHTLTISGEGSMANYEWGSTPWSSYKEEITKAIIEEGITTIGDYAFCECSGLTSITIPNSLTSIGKGAFERCYALPAITIPNSVTSIGSAAFQDCDKLVSVTIPDGVTSIGGYTFAWSGLTSITIPNSVTSIGDNAFRDCDKLTSIILLCKEIPQGLFAGLNSIRDVTIGDGVTSIGYNAFNGTTWYNKQPNGLVYAGKVAYKYKGTMPNNTKIILEEGTLGITDYAFKDCSGLTSIMIPNSVTNIGQYAFFGCGGLTSITIPNSVTSIGQYAFYNNSGLTSITIPNSVTSIGDNAFYGCSGLTSAELNCKNIEPWFKDHKKLRDVVIGDGVTCIKDYAFYGCKDLRTVTIGGGVTNIGKGAFQYCSGLASVNISDLAAWCNISFSNYYSNPISYAYHLYIGYQEVTNFVIPNGITCINDYAFYSCSGLTSITIPNTVTTIGEGAFSCCSGLTSITIPDDVVTIGNYAFQKCDNLSSVTFPNSVINIGYNAFDNTKWLGAQSNGVVYAGKMAYTYKGTMPDNTKIVLEEGTLGIGDGAFYYCSGLASIMIPNSLKSIGVQAFSGCRGLTSITIPNSVMSIGSRAFEGCSSLTAVHISDLTAWCNIKFDDWVFGYYHDLYINDEKITNLVIPQSITNIGDCIFHGVRSLTSVIIPEGVTSIGKKAFEYCEGITSLTFPHSLTSIGKGAFLKCSGLNTVYMNSPTPPTIQADTFDDYNTKKKNLYVPTPSMSDYRNTNWYDCFAIFGFIPDKLESANREESNEEAVRYTLEGRRISTAQKGINIIKLNDGTTKKVMVR